MLKRGKAYYCYTSPEELAALRDKATAEKTSYRFESAWREADPATAPKDIKPVVRLKAPRTGTTTIDDQVQGSVTISADQLEDTVLLRSDGTPTYMLAVVVDDHDMGVTHIIRGDDHLTNAFKQKLIYEAMEWQVPSMSHIPMIHGPDGAKLSKRHGALGVEAYREMGYLPEAIRNYLLRLGWSHGDDEIISTDQAIEWFNLESIGQSPSRFDFNKLESINGHYIRQASQDRLVSLIVPMLEKQLGQKLSETHVMRLLKGMNGLRERAKTLNELAANAMFYVKWSATAQDAAAQKTIREMAERLQAQPDWHHDPLMELAKSYATETGQKLGQVMQPLRIALTGSTTSPSVFEIFEVLGKEETLARLS
jgi:glutamyl-tRNA synthetase